jgi:cyclopropane-fatty-acyl-phospholipid synthase
MDLTAARTVLDLLFGPVDDRSFAVRFWTGVVDAPANRTPRFTLVLNAPDTLRRMLWPPSELRLGESFVRGDFDVEGDLERATGLEETVYAHIATPRAIRQLRKAMHQLPRDAAWTHEGGEPVARKPKSHSGIHSLDRDQDAVRSHYNVGNNFYQLWLDERMVYSCAYFHTGDEDIDTAQTFKLEHLCRKLRLQPGERLLDVGCGWGGLIRYAVKHFGVTAVGITLSDRQAELARERICAEGLSDRCEVNILDYRELPDTPSFDKVISVGMVEHVGRSRLTEYFTSVFRVLKPGGLFVNHGIVAAPVHGHLGLLRRIGRRLWRQGEFIDKYVFPDGELVPLADMIEPAERVGFETRDVEMLREHYMRTLRLWVARLEQARDIAIQIVGEQTYRIWRLYMAASAHAFASGRLNLSQTVFAKPDSSGRVAIPLTRADLYA